MIAIAAGSTHFMALTSAGQVVDWAGANAFGENNVPAAAQSGVSAIAAGGSFGLALKNGGVIGWGNNASGQTTIPAAAQSGVTAIAAGYDHSLAIKGGGVIAWGNDTYGQTDVPVAAQSGVISIAAGNNHNLALKSDGTIVAWGRNNFNQLNIPALANVQGIFAGGNTSLVLVPDTTPAISASATNADGTPYTAGTWTNQTVTVHFTCSDALSGVASCPADQAVSAGGVTNAVGGTVKDNAVNTASASFGPIDIDKTAPTISASATQADGTAYTAGAWTNQSVTVHFTCADTGGSNLQSCPADVVVQAEGITAAVSGTAADNAGNTASTAFGPVKIDKTAPTIGASATKADGSAYAAGDWTNQTVTVHFACSDGTSGVASCPADQVFSAEGVTAAASGTATDNAGNSASASFGPIKIDKTAPVVSCASADGLWHAGDVSVACAASDAGSGLANPADASFALTTAVPAGAETANAATGSRQVCDAAGNCATAGPIGGNKVDKKAPSIAITSPTGTAYTLGQAVNAAYSCQDAGSGLASCSGSVPSGSPIDTSAVGAKTFTVTATDQVGNRASVTVAYNVTYAFGGFFAPVSNPPVLNQVKAGRAVPIKFSLGGNQGLAIFGANSPASQAVACDSGAPVDNITQTVAAGGSSLSYDPTSGQYTYVWKTDPAWAGTCRQLVVTLNDGTTHVATFSFR